MMHVAQRTYLHFVDYTQLVNWSTRYLNGRDSGYNKSYTLKPLSSFLTKSREVVTIQDDEEYSRVTVKIKGGGVLLRDKELGKNIGTKRQFLVKSGQFIISKIDARNGAMGIIPVELEGAIVTNDFPLFDIDTTVINPDYLRLITTTDVFIKIAHSSSSGTTNRQRVDVDNLLQHEIPLPSLTEQEKLIADYNRKIRQAEQLSLQGIDLERKIENYFLDQIGYSASSDKKSSSSLKFIDLVKLDRWDGKSSDLIEAKFPVNKLSKYIVEISTGTTPPTTRKEYFNGHINFYTPSDLGNSIFLNSAERKISELAIIEKKARVFTKNTLLFVGIGSTVGKVGIINDEYASSNQQITGIQLDQKQIDVRYAFYYFNLMKHITTKEQTMSTIPIINQEKILNIPIVEPPLSKQIEIIAKIDSIKDQHSQTVESVYNLKQQAQQEFEQAIFS